MFPSEDLVVTALYFVFTLANDIVREEIESASVSCKMKET